jgi:hypothetical protein
MIKLDINSKTFVPMLIWYNYYKYKAEYAILTDFFSCKNLHAIVGYNGNIYSLKLVGGLKF